MVPILESNSDETSRMITQYTWYLSSIPLLATLMDVMSSMFCYEGELVRVLVQELVPESVQMSVQELGI